MTAKVNNHVFLGLLPHLVSLVKDHHNDGEVSGPLKARGQAVVEEPQDPVPQPNQR